jgi:hypothetical protein
MPEMPPPPPRRSDDQPAIDPDFDPSAFDQETPARWRAEPVLNDVEPGSNPFMAGLPAQAEASNPFLSSPTAAAPSASAPSATAPRAAAAAPASTPRAIPPAVGAPLIVRPGAASPEVRDAHAEFRRGAWQRPLILVLVAAAVVAGMTLLPSGEKATPTAVELSKAPPAAVIGGSLPPGRTTDEDVRAAEQKQLQAKPNDATEPAERPSDIPAEGEFANAFKAKAAAN